MNHQYKYSLVMWDWNGTLLDDVGAAFKAVNTMLMRRGEKPIDMPRYHDYIDVPIQKFYVNIFDLEKEKYSDVLKEYNDEYTAQMNEITLAQGALDVLSHLRNAGVRQAIVSSSEQNQLRDSVKRFELDDYFDAVLGAKDFFAGSKLERAEHYIIHNRLEPSSVLVVGDLLQDYEMAQSVGADCVLLSRGHHSEQKLRSSGATVIDEISRVLDQFK